MDRWALPTDVDVYYLTPTAASWRTGDREITCLFGNTDERGTLTGSLRNDGARFDADQHTYLLAEGYLNRAMDEVPAAEAVEDDLAGYRTWAGQVSEALRGEVAMLDGHEWPAGAERPVAALTDDCGRRRRSGAWRLRPPTSTRTTSTTARATTSSSPTARSPHARLWAWPPRRRTTRAARAGETTPAWRCDSGHSGEKVPA